MRGRKVRVREYANLFDCRGAGGQEVRGLPSGVLYIEETGSHKMDIRLLEDIELRPVVEIPLNQEGAPAIRPGGWHVFTEDLSEEFLERQIELSLEDFDPTEESEAADPFETISPIEGGFALMSRGRLELEPQCCADLGDLAEWSGILLPPAPGEDPAAFHMLWIGHPWVCYRKDRRFVYFTNYGEGPLADDSNLQFALKENDLESAIMKAERTLQAFAEERLRPLLAQRFAPENTEAILARMCAVD